VEQETEIGLRLADDVYSSRMVYVGH